MYCMDMSCCGQGGHHSTHITSVYVTFIFYILLRIPLLSTLRRLTQQASTAHSLTTENIYSYYNTLCGHNLAERGESRNVIPDREIRKRRTRMISVQMMGLYSLPTLIMTKVPYLASSF